LIAAASAWLMQLLMLLIIVGTNLCCTAFTTSSIMNSHPQRCVARVQKQHCTKASRIAPLMASFTSNATLQSSRRGLEARPKGPQKKPMDFNKARMVVQRQGLRTQQEYRRWISNNRRALRYLRFRLPEEPASEAAYQAHWKGWDDWLGIPLKYSEAVQVSSTLGIESQEQWWAFAREQHQLLLQLRLPSKPHLFYKREWMGYDEWLKGPGSYTPLVFPANWGKDLSL